jgi:hypothetical protein
MTPEEFIDWDIAASAALANFSEYVEDWMQRRAGQGKHNYHDEQYEAFQVLAAELISALDELREDKEQQAAAAQEANQQRQQDQDGEEEEE